MISFEDEKLLGRDFDDPKDAVASSSIEFNGIDQPAVLHYPTYDNSDAFRFEADASQLQKIKDDMADYVKVYLDHITDAKTKLLIADADVDLDNVDIGDLGLQKSLDDLLGTSNLTQSGCLDDPLNFPPQNMTDKTGGNEKDQKNFPAGIDGKTYPTAFIDFSALDKNNHTLDDLIGLGFNSTCKTCNRHYSVMFVDSLSNASMTDSDYKYDFKSNGMEFVLQIDISSLQDSTKKPITSGAELPTAMIEILDECYDFHYTQYASTADGKLYIFDDRPDSSASPGISTFDTAPYRVGIDTNVFNLSLSVPDTDRKIDLSYVYKFQDAKNFVNVNMVSTGQVPTPMPMPDAADRYVKVTDAATGKSSYQKYNDYIKNPSPNTTHDGKLYELAVSYLSKDAGGNIIPATFDTAIGSYTQNAIQDMLTNTQVNLNATDYTYLDMAGDEKRNIAIGANFETTVAQPADADGLQIQHSGQFGDLTKIPRCSINSIVLNLERAGGTPLLVALRTMEYADYALKYLSERRSEYGAYQNRLEHTYAMNSNTEENAQAAESRIRDTDMSKEYVEYSIQNIMQQASQSVLVQANQSLEWIMQLLQ